MVREARLSNCLFVALALFNIAQTKLWLNILTEPLKVGEGKKKEEVGTNVENKVYLCMKSRYQKRKLNLK